MVLKKIDLCSIQLVLKDIVIRQICTCNGFYLALRLFSGVPSDSLYVHLKLSFLAMLELGAL